MCEWRPVVMLPANANVPVAGATGDQDGAIGEARGGGELMAWRKKSVRPFECRCRYAIAVEPAREGCYKCQKLHEFPFWT